MMKSGILFFLSFFSVQAFAQNSVQSKPRILVSTDIGGTDPDDNQSMAHLLMYSDKFIIEGLISSPSYGNGSAKEIIRMIDLYEKDLPLLKENSKGFPDPDYLRSVTKQGRKGNAPFRGYKSSSEGSDWIIKCAREESHNPLWVLVWGGLEDLAQALHDAPDIQKSIRVYWIGGPNKKWSSNSYSYIVSNFPDLFFIEVNSSYYGFFSSNEVLDSINYSDYYKKYINGAGHLGNDFVNYYGGEIKMGDSPSLLYIMNGNPYDPESESWGGSFEKITYSSKVIFKDVTDIMDSVAFSTIIQFKFDGPRNNIPSDSICFWMDIPYGKSVQSWPGYYIGGGIYSIKYAPKKAETLSFLFHSDIPEINGKEGQIVVTNKWPGEANNTDYRLGDNWYSDSSSPDLYDGKIQGGKTISKWREQALLDWAERWNWLKKQ